MHIYLRNKTAQLSFASILDEAEQPVLIHDFALKTLQLGPEYTLNDANGDPIGSGGGSDTVAIPIFFPGVLAGDGLKYDIFKAVYSFSFAAGLTGWQANVRTNPGSTASFDLLKNDVSFGTVSFSTGGAVTLTSAAGASFAIGDLFSVVTSFRLLPVRLVNQLSLCVVDG